MGRLSRMRRSEAGEGVISAAIAVLIMAFLGVVMWGLFNLTMHNAASKVDNNVNQIGNTSGAGVGGTGGSPAP